MRAVGFIILLIIALFSGGCSLVFTGMIGSMGFDPLTLIWLSGFGVSALCVRGMVGLTRGAAEARRRAGPTLTDDERGAAQGERIKDDRVR